MHKSGRQSAEDCERDQRWSDEADLKSNKDIQAIQKGDGGKVLSRKEQDRKRVEEVMKRLDESHWDSHSQCNHYDRVFHESFMIRGVVWVMARIRSRVNCWPCCDAVRPPGRNARKWQSTKKRVGLSRCKRCSQWK